jgi:hypothetical protein
MIGQEEESRKLYPSLLEKPFEDLLYLDQLLAHVLNLSLKVGTKQL